LVAATAGVSPTQVQYYFRSKDELVAAAFEHVGEGVERGVEQRAHEVDRSGNPREVLRRPLHLWLPLDEARPAPRGCGWPSPRSLRLRLCCSR